MENQAPHPCCTQPSDPLTPVWRYMDLPRLISILHADKLFLSCLAGLEDPHEGSMTRKTVEEREVLFANVPNRRDFMELNRDLRSTVYVSCWHINSNESEAMWRIYCGSAQGVALQTTYQKLYESIVNAQVHMGAVTYIDYEKDSFPRQTH
jgi:hypothetical protein